MNLSMLGFFKYGNFLLQNFQWLMARIGIVYQPPHLDILLPVGISFYTFHSLSYTLDIYRGVLQPTKSLRDFILAVSFFPQLVAGPIVRAGDFLPQLVHPPRLKTGQFLWGLALMTLGLFEKIVLADTLLSGSADRVFDYAGPLVALDSWVGVIAFAGQIFFDFAGYSTCAIGAALTLGFHLKDNFRFPYAAIGFSDFWRRWHISLSTFLRDYLYIPLGGNQVAAFSRRAQSRHCHVSGRTLARRGVDLCRLGIVARLLSGDRARLPRSCSKTKPGRTTWPPAFSPRFRPTAPFALPGYFFAHPISRSPVECLGECSANTPAATLFFPRVKYSRLLALPPA